MVPIIEVAILTCNSNVVNACCFVILNRISIYTAQFNLLRRLYGLMSSLIVNKFSELNNFHHYVYDAVSGSL